MLLGSGCDFFTLVHQIRRFEFVSQPTGFSFLLRWNSNRFAFVQRNDEKKNSHQQRCHTQSTTHNFRILIGTITKSKKTNKFERMKKKKIKILKKEVNFVVWYLMRRKKNPNEITKNSSAWREFNFFFCLPLLSNFFTVLSLTLSTEQLISMFDPFYSRQFFLFFASFKFFVFQLPVGMGYSEIRCYWLGICVRNGSNREIVCIWCCPALALQLFLFYVQFIQMLMLLLMFLRNIRSTVQYVHSFTAYSAWSLLLLLLLFTCVWY